MIYLHLNLSAWSGVEHGPVLVQTHLWRENTGYTLQNTTQIHITKYHQYLQNILTEPYNHNVPFG
jgi:hypothetical protein